MGYLGAAIDSLPADQTNLAVQLKLLHDDVRDLRGQLFRGGTAGQEASADKLGVFQRALFDDMRQTFAALKQQDDREKISVADLPPALRDRFVGINGEQLLQVYPKEDVWKRDKQKVFVEQLRSVDPDVTGQPVQLWEYTNQLVQSYVQAAYYSLAAIVLLVFIHFRSVTAVFLSLLPVAVGCAWLAGIMGHYHIPLNPANIMTLPLVIGIGVTNGIQILNRFAEENHPGILSKSTGKAVLVSGLTAISGFGSLILAKHQGIRSLGQVMAVGIAACMIAALTFVPALLNLFVRRDLDTKQPSADNARSTLGREEPR
jgi:predicted RND superfamily exporter protein